MVLFKLIPQSTKIFLIIPKEHLQWNTKKLNQNHIYTHPSLTILEFYIFSLCTEIHQSERKQTFYLTNFTCGRQTSSPLSLFSHLTLLLLFQQDGNLKPKIIRSASPILYAEYFHQPQFPIPLFGNTYTYVSAFASLHLVFELDWKLVVGLWNKPQWLSASRVSSFAFGVFHRSIGYISL